MLNTEYKTTINMPICYIIQVSLLEFNQSYNIKHYCLLSTVLVLSEYRFLGDR